MTPRFTLRLQRQVGFTLVEMAIVLLIAGLLVAGISQMMSSSQKSRGDQAVANEVRTVTNALERMLVDQQANLAACSNLTSGGNGASLISLKLGQTSTNPCTGGTPGLTFLSTNYLPAGLSLTPYTIGIAQNNVNGRPSFRALILRTPDSALDDTRLSRVASLIGTQGGMISNAATSPYAATGVLGSWSVSNVQGTPGQYYGFVPSGPGLIAALTNTVDAQISVNTLSRINPSGTGQSEGNTMRNDLYMGGYTTSGNDAYAIHNTAGYGYVMTNAQYGVTPPTNGSSQYYVNVLNGSGGNLTNSSGQPVVQVLENNMVVTGLITGVGVTPPIYGLLQWTGSAWQVVGGSSSIAPQCVDVSMLPGSHSSVGRACWVQIGGTGGMIIQWGTQTGFWRDWSDQPFPKNFTTLCSVSGHFNNFPAFEGKYQGARCDVSSPSLGGASGFMLDLQTLDGYGAQTQYVDWFAIGY